MGLLAHRTGCPLPAIMDAILASGRGYIGKFFPDTDSQWKNAVSTDLLRTIVTLTGKSGFTIGWIDSIIITEQPKMAPYIEQMKDALSAVGLAREIIT
jgi:2-C-methyl-D-erythritol 2,4-cyclodiphosphate synthase